MERVQKIISNSGYCSRRKAEELINDGKVFINDSKAKLGDKASYEDIITIDGKIINKSNGNYVYYLINKPRGVVSTSIDPEKRKTIVELIDTDKRIYPVGRLDYDTTGALLLTNDGSLTNILIHPSNKVEKVYLAKLEGIITGNEINTLKNGIKIDNYFTKADRVKLKSFDKRTQTSLVEISIHEGHNHQIKKMFEAVGFRVNKLTRLSFAGLSVKNLKSGEYRLLNTKEVKQLYSLEK